MVDRTFAAATRIGGWVIWTAAIALIVYGMSVPRAAWVFAVGMVLFLAGAVLKAYGAALASSRAVQPSPHVISHRTAAATA